MDESGIDVQVLSLTTPGVQNLESNGTKKSKNACDLSSLQLKSVIHAEVWSSRGKLLGDVSELGVHFYRGVVYRRRHRSQSCGQ